MGLFSKLGKNKQDSADRDSGYYTSADDQAAGERARAKRASVVEGAGRTRRGDKDAVDPVLPEKKRARRRLVGAIALALAVAVGLPMLLDSEPKPLASDIDIRIPSKDKVEAGAPARASVAASAALDSSEEIVTDPGKLSKPAAVAAPATVTPVAPLAPAASAAPRSVAAVTATPDQAAKNAAQKLDRQEAEAQARSDAEIRIKEKTQALAKAEAEARAESRLKEKLQAKAKAEADAKADADTRAAAHADAEAKRVARAEADAREAKAAKLKEQAKADKPEPRQAQTPEDAARAMAILEGKPAGTQQKFVVQVAALASQDKVDELQKKLHDAGIASYTQKAPSGGVVRVRVGPFGSKDEAEKARAKLGRIGLTGTMVPV